MLPFLPPSSTPDAVGSVCGRAPRRPTINALTLEDDDKGGKPGTGAPSRKCRRPRSQANEEVPLIQDAIREGMAESLES